MEDADRRPGGPSADSLPWDEPGESDARAIRGSLGRNLTYGMLDSLGKAIVTGHYEGRAFPTEAELARQYSVSRSVTREAVKMLSAKGILTARPRFGTTIQPTRDWNLFDPDVLRWLLERKFSLDLLRQFNQLRLGVEPAAAALAASVRSARGLVLIERGYERMVAAERGDDDRTESDIAFHVAILVASGNPFFEQFKDVIATALKTSIRFTNTIVGHASLPDHERVKAAIDDGDSDGARKAMEAIIIEALELIETSAGNKQ